MMSLNKVRAIEMSLINKVQAIEALFDQMHNENASNWQRNLVASFRANNPELDDDLDFCFEVLAGKHKLGFTVYDTTLYYPYDTNSIRTLVEHMARLTLNDKSDDIVRWACSFLNMKIRPFMIKLLNRVYRLGYTNRAAMVTDKHCMLAKSYPKGVTTTKQYYIQEKLNGNRCIAYFDTDSDTWQFISRSQKPLNVNFDMKGFNTDRVYDGELMTRGKMGNRDFSRTSGLINSKYGDKSELMYFVYDVLDDQKPYKLRRQELLEIKGTTDDRVVILKVLDKITVYPNPDYNYKLDEWLDKIVAQGGEGIMLRDPDAPYHHSRNSGDRAPYLLKYKKTKTCDLRIVGWNEGKGKYEGMIGSFICENDEKTLRVNVAGISDAVRMSNPNSWLGTIIEVAYFEESQSKTKSIASLQHPRMKGVRHDKTETSMF